MYVPHNICEVHGKMAWLRELENNAEFPQPPPSHARGIFLIISTLSSLFAWAVTTRPSITLLKPGFAFLMRLG